MQAMMRLVSTPPPRAALRRARPRATSRKLRMIRSPASLDFSGWNCTPNTLPRSTTAANVSGVRRRGDTVGGHRARHNEWRESSTCAHRGSRPAAEMSAARRVTVRGAFQPTCGIFSRSSALPWSRVTRPGSTPSPGTSGASSLPSNSHCMPRQMPSSGVPGAHGGADRVAPRTDERRRRGEVADAGHDQRRAAGAAPPATRASRTRRRAPSAPCAPT